MPEYEHYKLGGESQPLILDGSAEHYGVALAMLQQTHRDVAILSRQMDVMKCCATSKS